MADLTPERMQELRRIAEAATPGPWAFPHQKDPYGCYLLPLSENNASYIAAFDPTTVLALLDEIERLQQKVQRANALAVAIEQALKAWNMGDYLTPFMDDLRDALLDFEEYEEGGATDGR